MGGNAFTLSVDLDSGSCCSYLHNFVSKIVGNAVEMPIKLDMVIDVYRSLLDMTKFVGHHRQWLQRRFDNHLKLGSARAGELFERPIVGKRCSIAVCVLAGESVKLDGTAGGTEFCHNQDNETRSKCSIGANTSWHGARVECLNHSIVSVTH